MLSITSLVVHPFQKICENWHVINVTISTTGGVYYNACCSKSMVQNLGFLCDSIATNDDHVLLTSEGK
jgi:hypothetical protein